MLLLIVKGDPQILIIAPRNDGNHTTKQPHLSKPAANQTTQGILGLVTHTHTHTHTRTHTYRLLLNQVVLANQIQNI